MNDGSGVEVQVKREPRRGPRTGPGVDMREAQLDSGPRLETKNPPRTPVGRARHPQGRKGAMNDIATTCGNRSDDPKPIRKQCRYSSKGVGQKSAAKEPQR